MPAATLDHPPAHLNGAAHKTDHHHPQEPRPLVPDPSLLIQQFADPGCAQSPLDLAREHGLDLDELIAFFDHPDTQRTLEGLDRLNHRRAASLAAAAHPLALQALTQITYIPTHTAPATTTEAVRKASTTLAHLARGTSRHAEDEPPPRLFSSSRSTANPRVSPSPRGTGFPARISPSSPPQPSPRAHPAATTGRFEAGGPAVPSSSPSPFSLSPPPPLPPGEGWGEGSMASLPNLHGFQNSPSPLNSHSRPTPTSRLLHRLAQTSSPFTSLTISARPTAAASTSPPSDTAHRLRTDSP